MNFMLLSASATDVLEGIQNVSDGIQSVEKTADSISEILFVLPELLGIASGAVAFIISAIVAVIGFLFTLIEFILPAIALFKMARKAGYKYPWLAFIPIVQTYLEYVLPRKEFNLLFKTKKRNVVAIADIILTYFGTTIIVILNIVPALGQLLDVLLPVVLILFAWRRRYDVICTFKDKELALPISILGTFIPLIYSIVLLVIMKRDPDYGAGNYYFVNMDDNVNAYNPQAYPANPQYAAPGAYPNQMYANAPVYNAAPGANTQMYANAPVYNAAAAGANPQMYANAPVYNAATDQTNPQMYANAPVYNTADAGTNTHMYANAYNAAPQTVEPAVNIAEQAIVNTDTNVINDNPAAAANNEAKPLEASASEEDFSEGPVTEPLAGETNDASNADSEKANA